MGVVKLLSPHQVLTTTHNTHSTLTMSLQTIVTALEYFQDPAVQEKVEEVGRIIYSNDSVTVNLSAVIAAGILALLAGGFLLYFLFSGQDSGSSGYGDAYGDTHTSGYGDYAWSRSSTNEFGHFGSRLLGSRNSNPSYPVSESLAPVWADSGSLASNNLIN